MNKNREKFLGKWHELKGKVKEKWGELTDNDIQQINGRWESLLGKLQSRYGYSKEEAEEEANRWCCECEEKHGKYEDRSKEEKHGKHEDRLKEEKYGKHEDRSKEEKKRKAG